MPSYASQDIRLQESNAHKMSTDENVDYAKETDENKK